MEPRLGSVRLYRLYFSLIDFTWGWIFCIFSADFIPERRSGRRTRLMIRVRSAIAHPQLLIRCDWVHFRQANKGREIKPHMPKSSTPRKSGPLGWVLVDSKRSTAFGPTKRRS